MDLLERIKKKLTGSELKFLLICLAIGLLITCLLSGKSRRDIKSMAVSSDEQYVAFFETGEGYKLCCYRTDGSRVFEYSVPSELSAGGHCVVWFESDVLCALFYRTNQVASFSLDGIIIKISENNWDEYPSAFPGFNKKRAQHIYEGKNTDIIYDKRNMLAYWLLGSERYLAVKTKKGEMTTILSWAAA